MGAGSLRAPAPGGTIAPHDRGPWRVSGEGESSDRIATNLLMAPGLRFICDVLIDQHFAERIGRLLGEVAQDPGLRGLGIDGDTAIIIDQERSLSHPLDLRRAPARPESGRRAQSHRPPTDPPLRGVRGEWP